MEEISMKTMRNQLLSTAAAVPMALTMAGGFAVIATVASVDAPPAFATCNPCSASNPCNPCGAKKKKKKDSSGLQDNVNPTAAPKEYR
ncbi:MAG: hypothetical protein ACR2OM_09945, partial [Aestuariivirgaceae bacterium]